MAVPFLLDANISPSLQTILPDNRTRKTTEFGLIACEQTADAVK
jgi:hypothetical protein